LLCNHLGAINVDRLGGTSAVAMDAMKNDIHAFHRPADCILVRNIATHELHGEARNSGGAGNVPDQGTDDGPVFQAQLFNEAPTDETGCTRHKDPPPAERHAPGAIHIG
jgi:hypothetical protein